MLQHDHQIAQSPARLGLTAPTSPSPNNLTNKPSTTPQQPLTIPTTSSSTLLPLLPPLQRAQTLLLQLSLLSSKLFEVSPNRSLWVSSFRGNLPNFLPPFPQQPPLALENPVTNTKELLSLFAHLQSRLFDTISELQQLLNLQDQTNRVGTEIRSADSKLVEFAKRLMTVQRVLDVLVDDYKDNRISEESRLVLSDVVSYAHKISYTTYAPPEFGAGLGPLRGALPPAPQEEQMRASQLYAYADLDVGIPKEEKESGIKPIVEVGVVEPGSGIGLLPKIEVPSGWKPGMPVELPMDLPVMPPGWKPGDPIPLPPLLDGISGGDAARAKEQQLPPPAVVSRGLQRMPEPIQVAPVQLDIDADDSSEYSGSDVSSDEDD